MSVPLDSFFLEKVLKTVNASIFILNLVPFQIKWINNSMPFMLRQEDNLGNIKLIENPDFMMNIKDSNEFFVQNPDKIQYRVFQMSRPEKIPGWFLTTAVVFEKDLKGTPQKVIATALDITGFIYSNESLAVAIKQTQHQEALELLTKREKQVILLLTQGLSSKEIALKLQRSFHTIETHKGNIKNKLGCKNVGEIPEYGQRIGLF